jgi:hypothetical protein
MMRTTTKVCAIVLIAAAFSAPLSYDLASGTYGGGIEQNVVVMIFNAGWSFRHWDDEVVGWNNRLVRNEFSAYAGLGLGGMFQIQAGFSPAGTRMQIRSDIPLTGGYTIYDTLSGDSFVKSIIVHAIPGNGLR